MFLMEQENQPTTNIIPDLIQTPKNEQGIFDDVDDEDLNLYIAKKADALSLTQEEMQDQDKQAERLEAEAAKITPTKTNPKYEEPNTKQTLLGKMRSIEENLIPHEGFIAKRKFA
eukprot:GHVN01066645.1.p2 GENE.GHVN01066645.1~~GHVN01066645.1.p2  ORF type:complete len:115 (+),score=14.70 GHVN01066645.1:601-945(+)